MGKIIYIMGKSSSGKDTVYQILKDKYPQLHAIVPYTTRPIREGETDGREYFFVDRQRMQEMQERDQIIEARSYDTKCGVWTYFTADDGQIQLDAYDYLVIGTLVSFRSMKEYFGEVRVLPVYLEVDDGVRLERALERERKQPVPQYEEMCRRFLADAEDFSEDNIRKAEIGVRFRNEKLDECMKKIEEYIGL